MQRQVNDKLPWSNTFHTQEVKIRQIQAEKMKDQKSDWTEASPSSQLADCISTTKWKKVH